MLNPAFAENNCQTHQNNKGNNLDSWNYYKPVGNLCALSATRSCSIKSNLVVIGATGMVLWIWPIPSNKHG